MSSTNDTRSTASAPSTEGAPPAREVRVGIAGVRGYKGFETARLVERHPCLRTVLVASDALAGHRLRDLDRELVRDGGAACVGYNDTLSAARDYGVELLLLATEPEQCAKLGEGALESGIRVVDLSGAHALRDPEVHALTYGFPYPRAASEAAFGLPELGDHAKIRAARLIAIPGAYATTVLIGLLPLARAGLIEPGSVVVDAKAGASTAGRKTRISLLFSELDGTVYANKIDRHQYYPEIVQELEASEGPGYRLTLATHLVPIARGVLATSYLRVRDQQDTMQAAERVREALRSAYADCPFMRVVERAEDVNVRAVVGTNRGLVGVTPDVWGDRVVVVSATDNLGKGTAGQAIQNANIALGLPETMGLELGTGGRP
ncbi:MAG: N-acetyl-gamma-glutamyl-phosphate reductase [Deltaproteobacteria bacterium]|nr:N-acetyl-gamma-glutamyl-phosphate reductase [Deltaproteobacteria bacterium]